MKNVYKRILWKSFKKVIKIMQKWMQKALIMKIKRG